MAVSFEEVDPITLEGNWTFADVREMYPGADQVGRFTVFKTGPWGQGPVFLQTLALLTNPLAKGGED
jgi:hypothetical protein